MEEMSRVLSRFRMKHIFIFMIWMLLLGTGFFRLSTYSNTPGVQAKNFPQWPFQSAIQRSQDIATLVIFVHPHCPCSEASIGELERLVPKIQGKVQSVVMFFKPKNKSDEWVKSRLWEKTKMIPGVQSFFDNEGVEAQRFGAKTSGQIFLFDEEANLIFSGGITPERGHMGDSIGRKAILSFVEIGKTEVTKTAVFGCSLDKPERAPADKGVQ